MPMSPERWKVITPSEYPWEREAFDFLREGLPDHEPFRAWVNFDFVADNFRIHLGTDTLPGTVEHALIGVGPEHAAEMRTPIEEKTIDDLNSPSACRAPWRSGNSRNA